MSSRRSWILTVFRSDVLPSNVPESIRQSVRVAIGFSWKDLLIAKCSLFNKGKVLDSCDGTVYVQVETFRSVSQHNWQCSRAGNICRKRCWVAGNFTSNSLGNSWYSSLTVSAPVETFIICVYRLFEFHVVARSSRKTHKMHMAEEE